MWLTYPLPLINYWPSAKILKPFLGPVDWQNHENMKWDILYLITTLYVPTEIKPLAFSRVGDVDKIKCPVKYWGVDLVNQLPPSTYVVLRIENDLQNW